MYKIDNYPTIGFWNLTFLAYSFNLSLVAGCGRSIYLRNWPIHQTTGSPCKTFNRGAKSSGSARGKNGGLGLIESIIGNVIT